MTMNKIQVMDEHTGKKYLPYLISPEYFFV